MADIINLRRARKARTRGDKDKAAAASRAAHGIAKPLRKLAEARSEKAARDLGRHRLEPDTDK